MAGMRKCRSFARRRGQRMNRPESVTSRLCQIRALNPAAHQKAH